MTQEEQDAIVGRTRRQYREAKALLAKLEARNREIAEVGKALTTALEYYPEGIHVSKHREGTMQTAGAKFIYTEEKANLFGQLFLLDHLAEYRRVKDEKDRLYRTLVDMDDAPGE